MHTAGEFLFCSVASVTEMLNHADIGQSVGFHLLTNLLFRQEKEHTVPSG
jgi:hypothetical protein